MGREKENSGPTINLNLNLGEKEREMNLMGVRKGRNSEASHSILATYKTAEMYRQYLQHTESSLTTRTPRTRIIEEIPKIDVIDRNREREMDNNLVGISSDSERIISTGNLIDITQKVMSSANVNAVNPRNCSSKDVRHSSQQRYKSERDDIDLIQMDNNLFHNDELSAPLHATKHTAAFPSGIYYMNMNYRIIYKILLLRYISFI